MAIICPNCHQEIKQDKPTDFTFERNNNRAELREAYKCPHCRLWVERVRKSSELVWVKEDIYVL